MSIFVNGQLSKAGRKLATLQIATSILLILICTICSYFFWNSHFTLSILSGGVIAVIPNVIFAYKAFKYAGASSSKKVVESFFSGVKIKMVVTVILMSLAFKFLAIVPVPFFAMYCLIMVLPLFMPLMSKQFRH